MIYRKFTWFLRLRVLLSYLAGLLFLLSVACSVQQPTATEESPKQEPPAAAISPEEIELAEVHLFKGDGPQVFRIEGQVHNNSPHMTLTEMDLKVVMQDCLETGICEVLAENVSKVSTNVAAGQAAAFQVDADFKDMPAPKGRLGWHYAVVAAK